MPKPENKPNHPDNPNNNVNSKPSAGVHGKASTPEAKAKLAAKSKKQQKHCKERKRTLSKQSYAHIGLMVKPRA